MNPETSSPKILGVPIEVRFRDMDSMGHVNNAVYFTYLEMARVAFYRNFMGATQIQDLEMIAAKATCEFRSPATWNDRLLARIWVSRVGTSSFDFDYEITDENSGRLIATAQTIQVAWDYRTDSKKLVPQRLRELLL